MLTILNEIKSRVPHIYKSRPYQLPESYYLSPIMDAGIILDAISEMEKAAEEFGTHFS
jgi:hypothetical protein